MNVPTLINICCRIAAKLKSEGLDAYWTEAKAEGKPTSRYMSTRNKKSPRTPGRLEKKKYNPFLKRRTLHRELR